MGINLNHVITSPMPHLSVACVLSYSGHEPVNTVREVAAKSVNSQIVLNEGFSVRIAIAAQEGDDQIGALLTFNRGEFGEGTQNYGYEKVDKILMDKWSIAGTL